MKSGEDFLPASSFSDEELAAREAQARSESDERIARNIAKLDAEIAERMADPMNRSTESEVREAAQREVFQEQAKQRDATQAT